MPPVNPNVAEVRPDALPTDVVVEETLETSVLLLRVRLTVDCEENCEMLAEVELIVWITVSVCGLLEWSR